MLVCVTECYQTWNFVPLQSDRFSFFLVHGLRWRHLPGSRFEGPSSKRLRADSWDGGGVRSHRARCHYMGHSSVVTSSFK